MILSRHQTFGEALDALFNYDHEDLAVKSIDGVWCVVRDPEGYAEFKREEENQPLIMGADFTW